MGRRESATGGGGASPATLPAPGFRFHPSDEELVLYYLKRKVQYRPALYEIEELEIYKHEPWQLAAEAKLKTSEQECYFFSALDKEKGACGRIKRKTKTGFWKLTGNDREIKRGGGGEDQSLIGIAKTLVFYKGRAPKGLRTNWCIHEYHLVVDQVEPEQNEAPLQVQQDAYYVLCKLFEKNEIGPPKGNNYAPFLEQEWENDDGERALIPGENVNTNRTYEIEQRKNLIDINKHPREFAFDDDVDDEPVKSKESLPPCALSTEAPLPLNQYKRRLRNSNNSIETTTHDQNSSSSSTITAFDASVSAALAEISFINCSGEKKKTEQEPVAATTMVPPPPATSFFSSSSELMSDLKKEKRQIILEKETYKLDLMFAEMIIHMLQGRINALNDELRKKQ